MHTAEIVLGLLVLVSAVASFAERLRVPAPSLLVLAGLAVGLVPGIPDVHLQPDLVAVAILPPLLHAAAVDVVTTELRSVVRPVAVLAFGLVGASAVVVALVARLVAPELSLQLGLVLGAVLASTDPVAVSALARRLQLPPRLLALVQGESLLNDATSLLLFRVVVGAVAAGTVDGPAVLTVRFAALGVGGAAIGVVSAALIGQLHRRTNDPVLESVVALLTPYAVFVVAEAAHTSGVTAVVLGGLALGRRRYQVSRGPARLQITHLYGVVVFVLESVVFALIGLELPGLVRHLQSGERNVGLVALAVTAALLLTRVVWVSAAALIPGVLDNRTPAGTSRTRVVAVTAWAGTRGVVPLAAALSIPTTVAGGGAFPHRALLLVLATTCTAITLVVQGMTLGSLVRRTGLVEDLSARGHQEALARHAAVVAALAHLDELEELEAASPAALGWLRREYTDRLTRAEDVLRRTEVETPAAPADQARQELRAIRRELIGVQSARLHALTEDGAISETVRRRVQRLLDLDEARATDS